MMVPSRASERPVALHHSPARVRSCCRYSIGIQCGPKSACVNGLCSARLEKKMRIESRMPNEQLLIRITHRLEQLAISERKAALGAGIGPDGIRTMRQGKRPRIDKLRRLEAFLGLPRSYLVDVAEFDEAHPHAENTMPMASIEVIGFVQGGRWQEALEWGHECRYTLAVPADSRFPKARRYGLEVRGSSMDQLYPEGTIVVAVNFDAIGRSPKSGERVVCLIRSKKTGSFEATLKEYQLDTNGRHILWSRSNDPEFQSPIILGSDELMIGESKSIPGFSHDIKLHDCGAENVIVQALIVQSIKIE